MTYQKKHCIIYILKNINGENTFAISSINM